MQCGRKIETCAEAPEPADESGGLNLRRLLPLAVIAVGFLAFFAFDLDEYLSFEALRENRETLLAWRDRNQVAALLIFIAVYAALVAISLPGAIWMTIGCGFLFGTTLGAFSAVVAGTIGASLIFLAARYTFNDYLRRKAGPMIRKMEGGFRRNALSYLLFLRLMPIFPFWLVNLVPAFLGVPLRTFVVGTFFGAIPWSLVYASIGNGLGAVIDAGQRPNLAVILDPAILLPILGLAMLSLLPVAYKAVKRRSAAAR